MVEGVVNILFNFFIREACSLANDGNLVSVALADYDVELLIRVFQFEESLVSQDDCGRISCTKLGDGDLTELAEDFSHKKVRLISIKDKPHDTP